MRRTLLLPAILTLLPLSAAAETPREALLRADRDFSRAAEARDLPKFTSFVTEEVLTFGGGPAKGRAKMLEAWAAVFTAGGPAMSWAPEGADASGDGQLGYTWGAYVRVAPGTDGAPPVKEGGHYVTIWKRGADGAYRVVLDIGTPPSPVQ